VQVYILNVLCGNACFLHRQANGARGLFAALLQSHAMKGLAC
jgi:hypothetical protein